MENLTISKEKNEALELHNRILMNANMACASWVESCKCLKQMRDSKLYKELGYEEFEDYTTQALNIKERQAYNYIAAYENLGEQFLQSNATVGITKLALLAAVPVTERQELVENNDLQGMTVKEVERLVKENDAKGEQIDLLTEEVSEKEERIRELEEELAEEKKKPVEVAVQEPSEDDIEKIRLEIQKQAESDKAAALKEQKRVLSEKYKKENEVSLNNATSEASKKVQTLEQQIKELEAAKTEATLKIKEFEKKLAVSTSPESVKFTFYFDALKEDYKRIVESLAKIKSENPEVAEKYKIAMQRFKEIVEKQITDI